MKRALFLAASSVAWLGFALILWTFFLVRGPAPRSGMLAVDGLGGPVDVLRDTLGVPHVWAESVEDAVFAQGFVHASDRLWQIEMFRRVATGRLSEIFGDATLSSDRFLRTLGMARAAERAVEALDPESLVMVEAYVRGVNTAIEDLGGPLPPEFVLLRMRPEPWTVADALAIEKIMAWDLTEYGVSLSVAAARVALDDEAFALVRPGYPEWGTTVLHDGETVTSSALSSGVRAQDGGRRPRSVESPAELSLELLASATIPADALPFLELVNVVRASNSWVVGGSRSRSGKPLVANDMHLGLNAPTIWYLAGLHAPGLDVVGMTLPGSPFVTAGHSAAVAWGFTNAVVDDADFFIERVDPSDPTRYLTPEGSRPFTVREESIVVRGRDEPVSFEVRETRHGPIMTPVESRAGDQLLALRWVAHDVSTTSIALRAMNMAQSGEEFIDAVRLFTNPHQNVVFADTAGMFGYWMAGQVPLRRSGRPPLLPVPGWTGEDDWVGVLPFDEHPHVINPERGYVATANNRQSRGGSDLLITDGTWAPPYRAMRIEELIEGQALHDAGSLAEIQMDVTSSFALRYKGFAAGILREGGFDEEAASLEAWDGTAAKDSRAATLFMSWRAAMITGLRRRLYGGPSGYTPQRAVERVIDQHHPILDSLAPAAARQAVEVAAGLVWGEAQQLSLDHPLGQIPVIGPLLGFGRRGIPREGSSGSVNVAHSSGGRPPFRMTYGASERHVVDMADVDGSGGFILPGGQSGYPRNPHAFDQLERWLDGELFLLPVRRSNVEAKTVTRLRLVPR
ncbi:MAG: penicillin acylase family protein [Gemmatimonadota bacterium]|nr:MAG: penicillin acylase family protein [Gemmatimonadota bacterium]